MSRSDLERMATAMVAKDKGLLAADESNTTIAKRLDKIGSPSTEEQRRSYRELLFTTPGIAQWISGVILYDETIRQKTRDGVPFPDYLVKLGIKDDIYAQSAVSRRRITAALRSYCNSVHYLRASTEGAVRIGLTGEPAGTVTAMRK